MIRDDQGSRRIAEHVMELTQSFHVSKNKELLSEHITFWEDRFELKLEQEKQLNKQ